MQVGTKKFIIKHKIEHINGVRNEILKNFKGKETERKLPRYKCEAEENNKQNEGPKYAKVDGSEKQCVLIEYG